MGVEFSYYRGVVLTEQLVSGTVTIDKTLPEVRRGVTTGDRTVSVRNGDQFLGILQVQDLGPGRGVKLDDKFTLKAGATVIVFDTVTVTGT